MPYISIKSRLVDTPTILHTATAESLCVEGLVNKTSASASALLSVWVQVVSGDRFVILKDALLEGEPLQIPIKGKALGVGDALVAQAYTAALGEAADITITLFS